MGELNLDKIERLYSGITLKKYDLESVRVFTGRMRPGHKSIVRRDLTEDLKKTDSAVVKEKQF